MNNPLDHIMGVKEAGEMWGLSADRVKGLCQSGEVIAKKVGNSWILDKNQPNPKGGRRMRLGGVKMRTWEREGYKVVEVEYNFDLHAFDVIKKEKVVATITPNTIEEMNQIIEDLNGGEDVDGWEDGMGNTISI
ncbi:hypothetical protein [Bacillus thuringiensis]|uniref:hypothetical protein n=1 Tax=Bacillus thuringiensis TaxID=1428 RepID=UPI0026E3E136|nr:hypothetical protein [Bacillus thuringiensis]MDO6633495.1 hypothetical protein [Bacillus thuringiensis]MDO6662787.1 hypothetical protein [Bacillus thuringiensis]MDO6703659.1 hypothetical protein [Bacillus thuringiensis]